jgi:hypothetical protein
VARRQWPIDLSRTYHRTYDDVIIAFQFFSLSIFTYLHSSLRSRTLRWTFLAEKWLFKHFQTFSNIFKHFQTFSAEKWLFKHFQTFSAEKWLFKLKG